MTPKRRSKEKPSLLGPRPCLICSYVASSLFGPHRDAFALDEVKIPLAIDPAMQFPQGLVLKDGHRVQVCEFCGSFLVHWLKLRETRHMEKVGKSPRVVLPTQRDIQELAAGPKAPKIVLPGQGGRILGGSGEVR